MKKLIAAILCITLCLSLPVYAAGGNNENGDLTAAAQGDLVAFPGAEGGGMYTTGARGASSPAVYHVTNLNNNGAGSFRDAVSKGNRIVVFDVAGTINIESGITLSNPNITILGQTSPGDGICISGAPVKVNADNIIMRYLRFRMGVYSEKEKKYDDDALGGTGSTSNLIVDHCSMSWSTDECCSFYAIKDSTIQWSIMTEPLNESIHDEGGGVEKHGYGGIWGGVNVTYHHNLVSSANSRFPRVGTSETVSSYKGGKDTASLLDIRNNVFYNWAGNSSYGGENGVRVNLVSNYYKEGPASSKINRFYEMYGGKKGGKSNWGTDIAVSGNYYDSKSQPAPQKVDAINKDNKEGVSPRDCSTYNIEDYDETIAGTSTNHTQYIHDFPIGTHTAEEAYNLVLGHAGASLSRDSVDERAVNDAKNGTAEMGNNGIIDLKHLNQMTRPTYSGVRAADTDGDGMADEYEDIKGLDKNNDDALTKAASGYFNIEEYANWLAEGNELEIPPTPTLDPNQPTPTPSPTPTPTAIPRHNITSDENMEHGTVEINGSAGKVITWSAAEHRDELQGAKTFSLNGTEGSDGTMTVFDTTTAAFDFDGRTSAKGETNPTGDPPFSESEKPGGSVFLIEPAFDGEMRISFYIFGGKELNIYDNTDRKYIVEKETAPTEGYYEYSFPCRTGQEIYAWAYGSKIGVEKITVTGSGASAKVGEIVNIKTIPDGGYRVRRVYTSPETLINAIGENAFTFIMPDSDVTVGAEFEDNTLPTPTSSPVSTPEPTPTGSSAPTGSPTPADSPTPTAPSTSAPEEDEYPYVIHGFDFDSDGKLKVDLEYRGDGSEKAKLIVAVFSEDDVLSDVRMFNLVGGDTSAVDYKKPETGNVKIFIWDTTTYRPLALASEK